MSQYNYYKCHKICRRLSHLWQLLNLHLNQQSRTKEKHNVTGLWRQVTVPLTCPIICQCRLILLLYFIARLVVPTVTLTCAVTIDHWIIISAHVQYNRDRGYNFTTSETSERIKLINILIITIFNYTFNSNC